MVIKSLIKKRATFKSKLTQFKGYVDSIQYSPKLSGLEINELNIRLSKIEELYHDYDVLQSEIETLSDIPDEQFTERETFESHYFRAIAGAREMLARNEQQSGAAAAASCGFESVSGSSTAHRVLRSPANAANVSMRMESEPVDLHAYQQKKNLSHGMMDLALLSANANQLRFVNEQPDHPYYYCSITFIIFSIIIQVSVGIGLLFHSRYNVKDEKDFIIANRINNLTTLGVFLITIVNVFVSSFSVADTPAKAPNT